MKQRDPIKTEIVKLLISAIAEEMGTVLRRTAFSTNIKERLDFSCAIFTGTGDLIAHAEHIPVHIGSMMEAVRVLLPRLRGSKETIIFNDPYSGGSHLPDITMVTPLLLPGSHTPSFFVANRAHHADVGGEKPGSMGISDNIAKEGVLIKPTAFTAQGEVSRKVLNFILNNVRTFDERMVDLMAQLGANQRGIARLKDLLIRYPLDELQLHLNALLDHSQALMQETIADLPAGKYSAIDYLDDDGLGTKDIPIALSLTVAKNKLCFDFRESSPQVKGPVNTVRPVVVSAVFYSLLALSKQRTIPRNAGCMRDVEILLADGSLLQAKHPAPVAAGNVETSQRLVDVILSALAQAIPDRIPASSQGTMNNILFGGFDSGRKQNFTYYETIAGGAGALRNQPGTSAVHSHMTNTLNTPVEVLEHHFPLLVTAYKVRGGSGGKGAAPGGDGVIRTYEALDKVEVSLLTERRTYKPSGREGGEPGQAGENLFEFDGKSKALPSKTMLTLFPGERISVCTPGGGGYGTASV